MIRLGEYLVSDHPARNEAFLRAGQQNSWFTPEFIELASRRISDHFLQKNLLEAWISSYHCTGYSNPKNIGIVMAGNIPMVGFHDLLCAFLSGHRQTVKLSSGDHVLMNHLIEVLHRWEPETENLIMRADSLKGCDAYIATGSNHSARYFEYYFSRYPHIIRHSRTSVAWLTGDETEDELEKLADDVNLYFGLGCRNVTKLMTPPGYDFVPLLRAMDKYRYFSSHHKYANNYDYRLAILLLNKQQYFTNGTLLVTEDPSLFSPIGVLHYETWHDAEKEMEKLKSSAELQCIVGKGLTPFGNAQNPALADYADGVDTMRFLVQC